MVAKKKVQASSYGFARELERALAQVAVHVRGVWEKIEEHLDTELISDADARVVLRACRTVRAGSAGPLHPVMITQTIYKWAHEARIDEALGASAKLLVDDYNDISDPPDVRSVLLPVFDVLRARAHQAALSEGARLYAAGHKDLGDVADLLINAGKLGTTDAELVEELQVLAGSTEAIRRLAGAVRRPSGIVEIDRELNGGVLDGTFNIFGAASGHGKSHALVHTFCEAMFQRPDGLVLFATLEMSKDDVSLRVMANMTAFPTEDLLGGGAALDTANQRMAALAASGALAPGIVGYFPARITTVRELEQWVDAHQTKTRRRCTMLAVDYAALLAEPSKKMRHEEIGAVCEQLSGLAKKLACPVWSAAQLSAEGQDRKKAKHAQTNHLAGAQAIGNTCDLLITLHLDEDALATVYCAKNRSGRQGWAVSEIPTDFAYGRYSVVTGRPTPW